MMSVFDNCKYIKKNCSNIHLDVVEKVFNSKPETVVQHNISNIYKIVRFSFFFFTTGTRITVSYDIYGNNGTITSPNFPISYPKYIRRLWNITVPSGKQVKLHFISFHLHSSVICKYDFVQIHDGRLPSSDVIVRMCGHQRSEKTLYSSGRHLQIYFETDAYKSYAGFQVAYQAVGEYTLGGSYEVGTVCRRMSCGTIVSSLPVK